MERNSLTASEEMSFENIDGAYVTDFSCRGKNNVLFSIHLSNVLTDHFSNPLPEKTNEDIPMKFSQCPFKNIFYRLTLSNRVFYLQIIHVRRKAIFTFYGTCIACVNNITFQIRYFT